jgi:hypothetical protein
MLAPACETRGEHLKWALGSDAVPPREAYPDGSLPSNAPSAPATRVRLRFAA